MKKQGNIEKALKAAQELIRSTTDAQRKRIDDNVTGIVLSHAFFASLLLTLKRQPRLDIPTMATDGVYIYWNPFFTESLDDQEIKGVLVHEVLHCALGHLWRKQPAWDHQLANQAADYAINNYLDTYNKGVAPQQQLRLPEGGLIDHQYDDMSFEQIYVKLSKNPPQKQQGGGQGEGFTSEGEFLAPGQLPQKGQQPQDGQGGSQPGEGETVTEADWGNRVEQARQAARVMGHLPGDFDRLLGELTQPEVDWINVLARFLDQHRKDDYDWAVPDRRYLSQGFYLPDLHSEGAGTFCCVMDTSGSVDDDLLNRFASELQDVINRVKPEAVHVIYCDAEVNGHEIFKAGDQLVLHPKGGGGTAFAPAFDYISEHVEDCAATIYFTDGFGSFPSVTPSHPVLWITYGLGAEEFPFGDVVPVNL